MQTEWNFNYRGDNQTVSLRPGRYKLECWGGSGGAFGVDTWTECAKGGYAKGEITLKEETELLVCVGQSGFEKVSRDSSFTRSGYNGAGKGSGVISGVLKWSTIGGGATDIRLNYGNSAWSDSQSLLSRILVAGGAGSTQSNIKSSDERSYTGGNGGGYVGGKGFGYSNRFTGGGTQYEGGMAKDDARAGSFGKGNGGESVGGGGGWFGGAGDGSYGSGGGSGYALTKDSYKPPGYIPTSKYYLENVVMTTGGNTTKADGYAKITLLQALPFLTISSYNSTQATFKADHTDPALLTKIEIFIDDVLKETITEDLTTEKTINYTLEDNALHTLKIVVTDSANATVEKVVSISKGVAPLPSGSTTDEVTNKWIEIKDTFKSGKTSIINTLALKNIEASLNNTLVELSEKIKTSFDSSDASVQDLMNQLTEKNNIISQLNAKYKIARGTTSIIQNSLWSAYLYDSNNNNNYERQPKTWIGVEGLNFVPNLFFAECEYKDSSSVYYKHFVFGTSGIPSISGETDFVVTSKFRKPYGNQNYSAFGQAYKSNKGSIWIENNTYVPAIIPEIDGVLYNWYAIKFI
ncbi:hypothetical protein LGK37_14480 [Clostridioides difficile]|nr:hypothetical protein [Clostridioides difficile]